MLYVLIEECLKAIVDPLQLEDVVQVVHHAPSALPPKWLWPGQKGIDRPVLEESIKPHMLQPRSPAFVQSDLAERRWHGQNVLATCLVPNPERRECYRDRWKQRAIDRRRSQANLPSVDVAAVYEIAEMLG